MNKKIQLSLQALALVLVATAHGAEFKPQYTFRANDTSQLYRLARENAWMQEFFQSNLYRGLSLRLSPALTTVADTKTDSWQGRLLDFMIEKIASKRPISISYYRRPGLSSPIGVRLESLSEAEITLIKPVIKQLRNGNDEDTKVDRSGDKLLSAKVTPILIQQQKFAVVLKGSCLSASRDPKVATDMSLRCPKDATATDITKGEDARVDIDLGEVAPSFYPFATRFAGFGNRAHIALRWNESAKRFDASKLNLDLAANGSLLRSGQIPAALMQVLPADTFALASFNVPKPKNFRVETINAYLRSAVSDLKSLPDFNFTLAAVPVPDRIASVLILDEKETNDQKLEELRELFSGGGSQAVEFRKLCGSLIALSPTPQALDRLVAACDKKTPTLANQPQALRDRLLKESVSAGAFLNLADIAAGALREGWGNTEQPPEMKQSEALLLKLPRFSFGGNETKAQPKSAARLELDGVQQ